MRELTSAARPLAPEDIMPGVYVMPLHIVEEFHCPWFAADRVITTRWLETPESPTAPARVRSVCLPFVIVETAKGKPKLLDVRRTRLASVPAAFAACAERRA